MEKDFITQQILKIERKDETFFMHVITHLLYLMDLKSMVYSLEKLYSGLDQDDATMLKQLAGLCADLLYFMLTTKHMFEYL